MADSLKQKTIKGVTWSFLDQFLVKLFNLVFGIILARLLTPADYGLIGMLGMFIGISCVFIDGGFASALIQCQTRTEKDLSTVFLVNLGMSILFYVILFACAPLIASFYHEPLLIKLTRIVSISLIIGALSSVHGTLQSINVDFKTRTKISIINALLSGCLGITCAYLGCGVWALVIQSLSSATINTIATIFYVKWWPRTGFSRESFYKLFSYGSKLLAATLISSIYDNIYPLVIGKTSSPDTVGKYSRAGQFPQIGNNLIIGMINRVAFPIFSQIQDDNQRLLRAYEKYIQFSCFIIFPILMGLCGCARPIIMLLLTDKWADCIPLMQILCFSYLFTGITIINLNLLYVKGRSDLVLRLEIIKKSFAFLIVIVTSFFNVTIMCLGQVVYSFIALYINTFYTKKILNYGLLDQMKVIYPYLLISLTILAESWLLCHFISNNWVSLLSSICLCVATYIGLHAWTRSFAYSEAKIYLLDLFDKIKNK